MEDHLYSMFSGEANKKELERVQIEKLMTKAAQYWPLFIIAIIISMAIGFAYLKYVTPAYKVRARVLIKDDKKANSSEGQLFEDLGLSTGVASIDNEIEIMKSRILMQEVVTRLGLNIRYFTKNSFKEVELYKETPLIFTPLFEDSGMQGFYAFEVIVDEAGGIAISEGDKKWTTHFGDTVNLSIGPVLIEKNENTTLNSKTIKVTFTSVEALADSYLGALEIEPVNKQVSIINMLVKDNLPTRGEDVLNTLIAVYLQANINDRNKISVGTIEFIDDRLNLVENELKGIETQLASFKQRNNIINITDQSRLLLDNSTEYNKQLTGQEVQLSIINSLEDYLQTHEDRIVPSTLLMQDVTLIKLIERYNLLQAQKQSMLMSSTEQNPYVRSVNKELVSLREDMKNNLASLKKNLNITRSQFEKETGSINRIIGVIPEKERIMLEYTRKQAVMSELYLFLLKKREETAISKSATLANARILEPARKDGGPFFPRRSRVYLMAFAIGLLVPASWVLVRELFNIRIKTIDDITSITKMPIIGEIGRSKDKNIVTVQKDSKTIISEQFRALRTNIQFLLTSKDDKVIMMTSSMGGEGKSFLSINLSSTLSISGKKVVLMELDLRKPKVSHHLSIEHKTGFSDYAIGKASIDDIITHSGVHENLYVIPSGPIPPNPSELIMLPQIETLFKQLKERFDFVIIDTSPIGLVTDAQLLARYSDAVLYVVRQNYTYKQQVKLADELYRNNKMPAMSIVVNDVRIGSGGYGYRYGYGNGYYTEDHQNKNSLKGILNRLQRKEHS